MNSQMGFSSKLRRLTAPVCVMIRGELAIGAHLRATDLYAVDRLILTMMQSYASAAQLRAAGPFSRSASSARFEYGFPATSDRQFGSRAESQRERRKWC